MLDFLDMIIRNLYWLLQSAVFLQSELRHILCSLSKRINHNSQVCCFREKGTPLQMNCVHPHPRCDAICCSNNCLSNRLSFNTMSCYSTTLICINADLCESKERSWHYINIVCNNTVNMQLLQIWKGWVHWFSWGKLPLSKNKNPFERLLNTQDYLWQEWKKQ